MAAPEQTLIRGSSIGDTAARPLIEETAGAVEELVREHARFVFQVAYSVLRHAHDAEDVVQETFLRVMKHERELATVRDPRAWLARIAWRIAVDRRRSDRASTENPAAVIAELRATGLHAEEILLRDEALRLLAALVAALPGDLRAALQLSTVQEMSAAEIGAVLGIPEASVRTRLFRARQMLKEKFVALTEVRT